MNDLANVTATYEGEIAVVRVDGEVDLSNAEQVARSVRDSSAGHHVVLDLSYLAFLDSAGIRAIIDLKRGLSSQRRELRLVVPDDAPICPIVTVAELGTLLTLHTDVGGAIRALGA
ncbi:MAG: STAS domain-containing protein [Egibacteraceae bacterium]